MKKDSNMFNDNSIETEGVPADKTAEIPKAVDSTEEENAKKPLVLFGREFSRKQVCVAGAGILCAALLIGGGAYAISHASWTGDSNAPAVSQSKDEEKQDMVLTLEVKADGWDADTSTPIIAHIKNADGKVDFYTAIAANKQVTVKVGKSGTYTVTFISPVNADGSIYKVSSKKVTAGKADKKTASTGVTFNKVDADKVTKDDLTAIAKDVAAAVKKGDSTLTGDKGAEVVKKFEDNIKKNPNADADAVEKESEKAQETAKEDKSDAKTPETSDNKKNDSGSKNDSGNNGSGNKSDSKPSGGSGNSGSGSSSGGSSKKDDTTAHQHNWVAQTKTVHHDAQYKTVHHDAVTHQVWHDAVTEEHYICNQCGADITSDPWGHLDAYDHGGYHSSYVTVKQGYYETVTDKAAYDEQVQVSAAWDETVTTGYKCSSCGATK
ncbi:hypothetical protein LKD31_13040 [Oscillospiraceae bacterium CLA-AA-H250]|uniref:Uncharacterized protein n=1 Tax=Hominenteromicrobium mulieris TaxID=2885357 RepID=A0AAE3AP74_9FIRM|nr:hypothetical protein [Hominenteromicrobium mulieris]MCC2137919.1 hypothetical protein [Hominenteromicrobium mulieris]